MAAISQIQQIKKDWAVSHVPDKRIVPVHRLPVTLLGAVQAPVYGSVNQVTLITYTVRANWACLITNIILGFQGSLPDPLPGDVVWTVDIDRPLGSASGYFEKDYGAITLALGNFTRGYAWPVEFMHRDNEVIRVKGYTVQNVGTGPGNFITAAMIGYEWPEGSEDD